MNKRLLKRHKRQVDRAKERVKLSEPDVRTPEQISAAREASRPSGGWRNAAQAHRSGPTNQNHGGHSGASPAKADA